MLELRDSIQKLIARNKVTLVWVPGHEGIAGNEAADELARKGASTFFNRPEPFCGLLKSSQGEILREVEKEWWKSYWETIPGLRQAKNRN